MDDKSDGLRSSRIGGLRRDALRAGLYLFGRHGVDVVLGVVAEPLIARLVGPFSYGLWIAGQRVFLYMTVICALGIDVYLLRKEGEVETDEYHQAFTVLLLLGVAGIGLGLGVIALLRKWVAIEGFGAVASALIVALPVVLSMRVPVTQLERALDYRSVAIIEVSGRLLFYTAAVVLAFLGWGAWAIVLGFWLQLILSATIATARARYRPRFRLRAQNVKQMIGYGAGFSAANWIYRLRDLVNPVILGHFAGAEAVGYVGLAERIVTSVGFVRHAAWRLSMAVLGRVQDSRERLAAAVSEGTQLQVMALAPCLLAVGLALPFAAVPLFGEKWKPLVAIYPFIATAALLSTLVNLQGSALYVLKRNWLGALCNVTYLTLFAGSALLLVPKIGWLGYGWAEFAAIPAYYLVHRLFVREVGRIDYRLPGAVVVVFAMGFFWQKLGWVSAAGFIGLAIWPLTWRTLREYALQLRALRYE